MLQTSFDYTDNLLESTVIKSKTFNMGDGKRNRDSLCSEDYDTALENALAYPFKLDSILDGKLGHFMHVQSKKIGVMPLMLVGPLLTSVSNVMNKATVRSIT